MAVKFIICITATMIKFRSYKPKSNISVVQVFSISCFTCNDFKKKNPVNLLKSCLIFSDCLFSIVNNKNCLEMSNLIFSSAVN